MCSLLQRSARRSLTIEESRSVQKCVSPAAHSAFHTRVNCSGSWRGCVNWPTENRWASSCVSARGIDVLAICKAMLAEGVTPDFIIVDGAEGGTAAAPLEYEDHVGLPLTDGLMIVHNALVGAGLRSRIRIGASGKVATGNDIVKRLIQGADYTNSARSMMMAAGCIQSQRCHTNHCPVGGRHPGSAPRTGSRCRGQERARVPLPAGHRPQAMQMMGSMGVSDPSMSIRICCAYVYRPTSSVPMPSFTNGCQRAALLDHAPARGGRIGRLATRTRSLRRKFSISESHKGRNAHRRLNDRLGSRRSRCADRCGVWSVTH